MLLGCADNTEKTAADMIELTNWQFTSGVPNNAITVHSENERYVFDCTVDNGQFWSYSEQKYVTEVELNPEETTWGLDNGETSGDFISITINDSNGVCGYAVIAVSQTDSDYSAEIIKFALFDEEKTTEQVTSLINQVKANYNN